MDKSAENKRTKRTVEKKEILAKKGNKRNILMRVVPIVIAVLAAFYFISIFQGDQAVAVIDDFPIWILRDGDIAIYREMNFSEDSMEKQIVVVNLSNENQEGFQIYERIPKEFAENASDLEFSIQPTIIEDDPLIMWDLGPIVEKEKPPIIYYETPVSRESIIDMFGRCRIQDSEMDIIEKFEKEEKVAQEISDVWSIDISEVRILCLRYWKNKHEWAQKQVREELQAKKEKVTQVIEPGSEEFAGIQKKAKEVIKERMKEKIQENKTAKQKESSQKTTLSFTKDSFPLSLIGFSLAESRIMPIGDTCYKNTSPTEAFTAMYTHDNETITVGVIKYDTANKAKTIPKTCSDLMESEGIYQGLKTDFEKKDDISGYGFWLSRVTYQGQKYIGASFNVFGNYVIGVSIPSETGGVESQHRSIMSAMQSAFGTEDSQGVQSQQQSQEQQEQILTPDCIEVDLSSDYNTYYHNRSGSRCTSFEKIVMPSKFGWKCKDSQGTWKGFWVKEISTSGFDEIQVTANLKLKDHARLFTECSGDGVKYDDYVALYVLSSDPRSSLSSECSEYATADNWGECSIGKDPSIIGKCGVSKCSTIKDCEFDVDVSSLSKVYLGFRIADAWAYADIEGILSNLQICGTK